MNKIVLIGAGSTQFGLGTIGDIFKSKILEGSTVNAIVDHAKDDSIIILGVSPKNPIMKYFFGSKPISIAQKCNCPVLITK